MSGTSLDGLDIAYCIFTFKNNKWDFSIEKAETIIYNPAWRMELSTADTLSGNDLWALHVKFGHFIGKHIHEFVHKHNLKVDYIASHGHTVFHQPHLGYTAQIGDGASIASESGINVICDFRSTDVAYSGQGAPLVPIGDKLLFADYKYCLNIGGICNISFDNQEHRVAWDVAPANIILNYYSAKLDLLFDENGDIAASGKLNMELLNKLNNGKYYNLPFPKSLGKEYIFKHFIPLIDSFSLSIPDILNTICEHIAVQISRTTNKTNNLKILVTGGGAFNKYLIERIKAHNNNEIIIPCEQIINFKEALIFGFLGVLRLNKQPNCLKEVTGATINNIGGAIYIAS